MPHTGPRAKSFREINLVELGLPAEAMPLKNVTYKGMKGYTLYSANGAVTHPHTKWKNMFRLVGNIISIYVYYV